MGNLSFKLIPRKTLSARSVSEALDAYNLPAAPTYTPFTLENCGVQPVTGFNLQALPEGFRDKKVWYVYTTTPVQHLQEGVSLPDEVEPEPTLLPGTWAKVIKSEPWSYGLQSHYRLTVVEVNER